jgi:hypothetical protein
MKNAFTNTNQHLKLTEGITETGVSYRWIFLNVCLPKTEHKFVKFFEVKETFLRYKDTLPHIIYFSARKIEMQYTKLKCNITFIL